MPSYKVEIKCEKDHPLYAACYRGTSPKPKMGRIEGLMYCPVCDEFYQMHSEKIQVTLK